MAQGGRTIAPPRGSRISNAAGGSRPGHRWPVGAVVGLLTAGVALGVAQLVAAFVGELASPVIAVGEATIDAAPPWVKEFAIRTFGTNDKLALLVGIGVLLAVFAVVMGVLSLRWHWIGFAGLAAFGLVGLAAATTRPTADALSWLPSVLGVVAGAWAFRRLLPGGRQRPARAAVESPLMFDRRRFLVTGLALGGAAVATGLGSELVGRATAKAQASRASLRIPRPSSIGPTPAGADLRVAGLSPFITPNLTFYRVDTAIIVPKVTAEDWRLRIHGMVDREIELDFARLVSRPLIERDITLTCVSNEIGGHLVGNARWIGAPLAPILQEAGIRPGATQLVSRSVDGFTIGTPTAVVTDGRDAMLAVAMNGEPLPLAHGFPVRIVVPGLYGYVSAMKWVVDLELTTFEAYDAYWVQRGWSQQAPIKTMSRIDTPRSGHKVAAGEVPVAGVAWAQHRGIEGVEVRVDDGPWQPATLATEDTIDTWRQWLYRWQAKPGRHRVQVRATDKTGYTQTGRPADPVPNGATGWHTIVVKVT